jgi:hypothetical protein
MVIAERRVELGERGATQRDPGVCPELVRRTDGADVKPRRMSMLAKHGVENQRAREAGRAPWSATAGDPPIDAPRQRLGAGTRARRARPCIAERERRTKGQYSQ